MDGFPSQWYASPATLTQVHLKGFYPKLKNWSRVEHNIFLLTLPMCLIWAVQVCALWTSCSIDFAPATQIWPKKRSCKPSMPVRINRRTWNYLIFQNKQNLPLKQQVSICILKHLQTETLPFIRSKYKSASKKGVSKRPSLIPYLSFYFITIWRDFFGCSRIIYGTDAALAECICL